MLLTTAKWRGKPGRKNAPRAGGAKERNLESGRLRDAAHFGDGGLAVEVLVQDFARIADAFAAHGADAQFLVQFGYRGNAEVDRLADFIRGDRRSGPGQQKWFR